VLSATTDRSLSFTRRNCALTGSTIDNFRTGARPYLPNPSQIVPPRRHCLEHGVILSKFGEQCTVPPPSTRNRSPLKAVLQLERDRLKSYAIGSMPHGYVVRVTGRLLYCQPITMRLVPYQTQIRMQWLKHSAYWSFCSAMSAFSFSKCMPYEQRQG